METASPPLPCKRRWLTFSLRSLMILLTLCCLVVGGKLKYDWYQKKWLVGIWVAPIVKETRERKEDEGRASRGYQPPAAPARIRAEDEVRFLEFGILELDTPEERFSALQILVDSRRDASLPIVRDLIPKCRYPDTQAMLLHLLSLARSPDDIPRIEPFLQSRHAEVRGAAAESIGFIHEPTYGFAHGPFYWGSAVHLDTQPVIDASFLVNRDEPFSRVEIDYEAIERDRQSKIPMRVRQPLESMMLQGRTQEERTAAARALVTWPPEEYSLRLAEWGVWID